MAAVHTIGELRRDLGKNARRLREEAGKRPAVTVALQSGAAFLIGFILAHGRILEEYAPFGLGFVAAAGSGPGGFCALMGTSLGYGASLGLVQGMAYVSAAVLIYAVAFAFYDVKFCRSRWFMPLTAAAIRFATALFTDRYGIGAFSLSWELGLETLLVALSARMERIALLTWLEPGQTGERRSRFPALLFLGGALAAAMKGMLAFRMLDFGLLLAAVGCGWLALHDRRDALTAAVGVGLLLDLGQGMPGYYLSILALGTAAAVSLPRKRFCFPQIAFLGAAMIPVVLHGNDMTLWSEAVTLLAAAAAFPLLPAGKLFPERRERPVLIQPVSAIPSDGRKQAGAQLRGQAQALRKLCEDMRKGLHTPPGEEAGLEPVFDRAAEQVCRSCPRYPLCWKQNDYSTYQAFRKMLQATRQRGYARLTDAPLSFQNSCVRGAELVAAANMEYASLIHRRQLDARLRVSRDGVWRQYDLLAGLLEQAAEKLNNDLTPDPVQAAPVIRFLRRHGYSGEVRVGRDLRGRMVIQLWRLGGTEKLLEETLQALYTNMGTRFRVTRREEDAMTLVQEDRYRVKAGVAAVARDGQTVSGDGGTWFRDSEGIVWVVLCDGMGSGPEAARQSGLTLRLLEDFLKAGMEPQSAMGTLSAALSLRGEQELGFTTIDLLSLDLFTGQCRSYKLGAAPTYLRRSGKVVKLGGKSLPAGLDEGQESRPDQAETVLQAEDLVIMVSDGVTDGEEDEWVWKQLREQGDEPPRVLAAALLEASSSRRDDRTVLVLRLSPAEVPADSGKREKTTVLRE